MTGCQMPHCIIVLMPYINLLNLSWLKNVFFFLRNMEPLKPTFFSPKCFLIMVNVHKIFWQNGLCQQCNPRSDYCFRSSLIRFYIVCRPVKYFMKQLHKKQNLVQKRIKKFKSCIFNIKTIPLIRQLLDSTKGGLNTEFYCTGKKTLGDWLQG